MDHLIDNKTSVIDTAYSLMERNIVEKHEGYRGPKAALRGRGRGPLRVCCFL
jgi:hypothetical protein